MAITPSVGSTASSRPALKATIAQMMVPANAMGSIRLRGSPPIHALVTPAFTLRLEIVVDLVDKVRTRVPQFDISHARNELLDKPAETLTCLL